MADQKLTVVARIKAKPGLENEVEQVLLGLIEPTRQDADCIDYVLHQSAEDPGLFLFFENWTSQAALEVHLQTPHLQDFIARAEALLGAPLDVTTWHEIG